MRRNILCLISLYREITSLSSRLPPRKQTIIIQFNYINNACAVFSGKGSLELTLFRRALISAIWMGIKFFFCPVLSTMPLVGLDTLALALPNQGSLKLGKCPII